ncbi:DUF397 domain-containing protein [Streptomyces sp. NPDC056930]|uniref:DUF397 domain-containing protein n=1 Tax=Streptomyces sp. NPDC056930 TaxID=3345967 RepID=UPI003630BEF5
MTEHIIPNSALLSGWRKSSYSGSESGSCVEVLDGHPSGVPVRDSKAPHSPALVVPAASWASFIAAVRNEELVACTNSPD